MASHCARTVGRFPGDVKYDISVTRRMGRFLSYSILKVGPFSGRHRGVEFLVSLTFTNVLIVRAPPRFPKVSIIPY